MTRRPVRGWDEQDAYTSWRKYLARLRRAGEVKRIKRATHRRERREAKQWINEQQGEEP